MCIMESFMDEVHIESVVNLGTKITMKKTIEKLNEFYETKGSQDEILI